MPGKIKIFVSYSHSGAPHRNELFAYLKGLEHDGVEFWWDEQIATGELWDDGIKTQIAESDIALVLASQYFLDSAYCTNVEIGYGFVGWAACCPRGIFKPAENYGQTPAQG